MASAYGVKTSSILDVPIERESQVARHLNANGVDFVDANTVHVLNYDISSGALDDYNEGATSQTVSLVETGEQVMTLAYNKYKFLRIQDTLDQDTPVEKLASKVARTWAYEKFVPDFDAYALAKIIAARPIGNKITRSTSDNLKLKFFNTISAIKEGSSKPGSIIAFVPYRFSDQLKALITSFDGSDLGYKAGKNGVLGQIDGAVIVETKNSYFTDEAINVVAVDKHAVVRATPKMDPRTRTGMKLIKDVPGHGGSELQLRSRGDVFVLSMKAKNIATLEQE